MDELAAQAEQRTLLEATARHYERLCADPEAWETHRAEVAAWDGTAADGLTCAR